MPLLYDFSPQVKDTISLDNLTYKLYDTIIIPYESYDPLRIFDDNFLPKGVLSGLSMFY